MHSQLLKYVQNPDSDISNFELGLWYDIQGHKSPATSFYLKCAENTEDRFLAYECLLRMHLCYRELSGRDHTCEHLLKSAISLEPKRPEAYWLLSQLYEWKNNWTDSYLYASIGIDVCKHDSLRLNSDVGYESEYMLIFQKAVASWWVGKPKDSRALFQLLKAKYLEQMNYKYRELVQNNLSNLGSGSESESIVRYEKGRDELRFKFKNHEDIEKNFSQVMQDLFVLAALDGKRGGTYLEIGSAHSFHNSNTALLETAFGWHGVGLEMKPELAKMHESERSNKVICENALKANYEKLLGENFEGQIIDYLQLDIEPSNNTFEALLMIPFHKYKFRVITYEHDHYVDITGTYRDKSRRFLRNMGYSLVFNDIAPIEGCTFEDWWVKEDLVDGKMLQQMLALPKGEVNLAKDMMLKKTTAN
jgi:hypothetical protein